MYIAITKSDQFHLLCVQVTGQDINPVARCRRVYAHAHDYHINSISNNRLALLMELWISGKKPVKKWMSGQLLRFCNLHSCFPVLDFAPSLFKIVLLFCRNPLPSFGVIILFPLLCVSVLSREYSQRTSFHPSLFRKQPKLSSVLSRES